MLVKRWQQWLLLCSLIVGTIYALPNIFGEEPIVQINNGIALIVNQDTQTFAQQLAHEKCHYKTIVCNEGSCIIKFVNTTHQLVAHSFLQNLYGKKYNFSLNLLPKTPNWLKLFGALPMKLGLDLRGGVELILLANIDPIVDSKIENDLLEIRKDLILRKINYTQSKNAEQNYLFTFTSDAARLAAYDYLTRLNSFLITKHTSVNNFYLTLKLNLAYKHQLGTEIIERSLETLRNRVNELGVTEAIVQRQGYNKIIIEMPGIQDPAYAKEILGKTATLDFNLLTPDVGQTTIIAPPNSKRIYDRQGNIHFIDREPILKGEAIISAISGWAEGMPIVSVKLDAIHAKRFIKLTADNIGRRLGVIYKETQGILNTEGKININSTETLISAPTIAESLGDNFRITGLEPKEAHDMALLLRSGAMPVNLSIISEHIIGPSLGEDNISKDITAACGGLLLISVFMGFYYSLYGIFANLALMMNLILLIAILSIFKATLTLPGIAGIVLTLGMAVDANVLIFERIREELRAGQNKVIAIKYGFQHALATIIDSNITTLIVALVLFLFSSGPVRGFAITLSIGIITSIFTAITGTQILVALWHRNPHHKIFIGI